MTSNQVITVLGIDPGASNCGYSIWSGSGLENCSLKDWGTIPDLNTVVTDKSLTRATDRANRRLNIAFSWADDMIVKYDIDCAAFEIPFNQIGHKDQTLAVIFSLKSACINRGVKIKDWASRSWQKEFHGHIKVTKEQTQYKVCSDYGLVDSALSYDVCDAIAIGKVHFDWFIGKS